MGLTRNHEGGIKNNNMTTNLDRLICITSELTEEISCLETRVEVLERESSEILEQTRYCKTMLGKARELLHELRDIEQTEEVHNENKVRRDCASQHEGA